MLEMTIGVSITIRMMILHEKFKLWLRQLMAHPTLRLLVNINYYFDWYDMDDEHRVKFAKMKLQRPAKIYRMFVERDNVLDRIGFL